MLNADHVLILDAYIARLTIADVEKILEAKKADAQAALNGNGGAQRETDKARFQAVHNAVFGMIEWDREVLTRVVKNLVQTVA